MYIYIYIRAIRVCAFVHASALCSSCFRLLMQWIVSAVPAVRPHEQHEASCIESQSSPATSEANLGARSSRLSPRLGLPHQSAKAPGSKAACRMMRLCGSPLEHLLCGAVCLLFFSLHVVLLSWSLLGGAWLHRHLAVWVQESVECWIRFRTVRSSFAAWGLRVPRKPFGTASFGAGRKELAKERPNVFPAG